MNRTRHRQRRPVWGEAHPAGGSWAFEVLAAGSNYDPPAAVPFPGVPVGPTLEGETLPSHPRWPATRMPMDHWLNVSLWRVQIDFSGQTQGDNPTALSVTVEVPTGRTATLAADGTPSLDDTEPVSREALYSPGATTTVNWLVSESGVDVGGVPYDFGATFSLEIRHGRWGFDNETGLFLVAVAIEAGESGTNNLPPKQTTTVDDVFDPPEALDQCPIGYAYAPGTSVQDPETGLYSYLCVETGPDPVSHFVTIETDPRGPAEIGDWHDAGPGDDPDSVTIFGRAVESLSGGGLGFAPTLSVRVWPVAYFEGW